MLNGFKQGDKAGEFTNISTHGCSVVDYCAVSEDFTDSIVKFCVCEKKKNKKKPTKNKQTESPHMPLLF